MATSSPPPNTAYAPNPYATVSVAGAPATPPVPAPAPAPRHPHWWQRRTVQAAALSSLLALSGLVILALVRKQTGTEGLLVGLGLAVLPVPLLIAAFRWLDRVAPGPWRNLIFSFAWGACAAALIAIVANSFATHWIATTTADPSSADTLGATVIAPIVEESSKAAALLLIFLFRRRDLTGLVDGVVVAGVAATGFAFTENVLYLGTAFGDDQMSGGDGLASLTMATFFVRVVMSPFAHPLFTVLSGIGFGLAATYMEWRRLRRALLPVGGLLLAIGMHALWNASSTLGDYGFLKVYAAFMVPAFGLLTWLVIWSRQRELHTIRGELPLYAVAGWLPPYEAFLLGSLRARRVAREYAFHTMGGKPAARAVAEYQAFATALAFLRYRARRGRAGGDFVTREERLLRELWRRKDVARPALAYATRALPPGPWLATMPWHPGVWAPGPWPAAAVGTGPGWPGAPMGTAVGGPGPYGYGVHGPGAYGTGAYGQGAYGYPGAHGAQGIYGAHATPGGYGTTGSTATTAGYGPTGATAPPGYGTTTGAYGAPEAGGPPATPGYGSPADVARQKTHTSIPAPASPPATPYSPPLP